MTASTIAGLLDVPARDLMTAEPVCAEPAMPLRAFARLLEDDEISGAPVVDASGRVIAVASRTDVLRHLGGLEHDVEAGRAFDALLGQDEDGRAAGAGFDDGLDVRVEDFMVGDPVTCTLDETVAELSRRMADAGVHRIVVVDDDRQPQGIVTSMDLVKAIAARR